MTRRCWPPKPGVTRRLCRIGLLLAGLLVPLLSVAVLLPAAAAAQQSVMVTAQRAEGYDRLIVGFDSPNPYEVEFDARGLVLSFERPASFGFGPLRETLSDLSGEPRVEEEGKRLVLPFAARRAMTHFELGGRLIVDLGRDGKPPPTSRRMPNAADQSAAAAGDPVPAAPAASPVPASPGAKPALATPQPTLAVAPVQPALRSLAVPVSAGAPVLLRVGVHDEYDRLVFDWPSRVDFELEGGLGTARVHFAEPGRLDASVLADTRVGRLERLRAGNAADGLTVELAFPAGVTARAFSLGRRVVVDLAGPRGAMRLAAVELSSPPREPESRDAAAPPAPAPVTGQQPMQLFPLGSEQAVSPAPSAPPSAPAEPKVEPAPESGPARPFAPPGMREIEPAGFRIERVDALGRPVLTPLPGGTAPWPEPIVLRFRWPESTRAAVMQNGPSVLLVFDRLAPDWATTRIATLAPELSGLQRHDLAEATAFSFNVSTLVAAQLHRDGGAWMLDLRPRPGLLDQPLPMTPDLSGRSLRLAAEDAGAPVELKDPVSGARLVAVPFGEEAGFSPGRRFPEFEILPSAQGLFVGPRSKRVAVSATRRSVRIEGIDAAALTSLLQAPEAPATPERGRRLFDPAGWRLEQLGDYSHVRQELQTAVATSQTAAEMTAARLALARFYFGHGFARETLGMLDLMFRDMPDLSRDPELMLMAGASRTLAHDYGEAVEILGDPGLVGEPEARLWQAMLAAAAQDWAVAADRFADGFAFAAGAARPVRVRLGLAAAETRLEAGDLPGAQEYLELVENDLQTAPEQAQHQLLRGMTLLAGGDDSRAVRLLTRVAENDLGSASARARLLLIERGIAEGSVTSAEAIEELEKLRFAWRGDAFEFALLIRLADLYESEGRIRPALRSLRNAVSNFPGHPATEKAAVRMQALFADLFTGDAVASMPAIAALSLYDEFRELTPPGSRGDAIIEALADRLVEIDLLDRAASLLDDQVSHRLSGPEKTRVGARLALVRLLHREPAKALAALDRTAPGPAAPEGLRLERARLRAKALLDLGQGDTAMDVLTGDDSPAADRLRVEIHRAAGRWSEVAQTLGRNLPAAGLPLDQAGAAQVLNAAVAHVLAEQRAELQYLARSYGAEMAETRYAQAFSLLAGEVDSMALASIADQLSAVEQAEAFMTAYRTRLAEGALSALN